MCLCIQVNAVLPCRYKPVTSALQHYVADMSRVFCGDNVLDIHAVLLLAYTSE